MKPKASFEINRFPFMTVSQVTQISMFTSNYVSTLKSVKRKLSCRYPLQRHVRYLSTNLSTFCLIKRENVSNLKTFFTQEMLQVFQSSESDTIKINVLEENVLLMMITKYNR